MSNYQNKVQAAAEWAKGDAAYQRATGFLGRQLRLDTFTRDTWVSYDAMKALGHA